ncbi:hypothetical protein Aperf_G00000126754 [Anoplocephala perfoliata]
MRVSAWSLDTDFGLDELLQYAVNSRTVWGTLVLVCVSIGEPWKLESTIDKTIDLLSHHIHHRMKDVDSAEMQELQESLERHFRAYVDPAVENNSSLAPTLQLAHRRSIVKELSAFEETASVESNDNEEDEDSEPSRPPQWNSLHPGDTLNPEHELPPVAEGAFVTKLRVPVVLVVTKTDLIEHMKKVLGYSDDTFDMIQLRLRQIAHRFGGSIIYTSARKATNLSLLNHYLHHRFSNQKFSVPAQTTEIDSIFIPAGWDSQAKMEILSGSIPEELRIVPSEPSRDLRVSLCSSARGFIFPCSSHGADSSPREEKFIEAEEEQVFLLRIGKMLKAAESGNKNGSQSEIKEREDSEIPEKHTDMEILATKALELAPITQESKGTGHAAVLRTFFNTLLTKPLGIRSKEPGRQSEFFINTEALALKELQRSSRFLSSGAASEDFAEDVQEELGHRLQKTDSKISTDSVPTSGEEHVKTKEFSTITAPEIQVENDSYLKTNASEAEDMGEIVPEEPVSEKAYPTEISPRSAESSVNIESTVNETPPIERKVEESKLNADGLPHPTEDEKSPTNMESGVKQKDGKNVTGDDNPVLESEKGIHSAKVTAEKKHSTEEEEVENWTYTGANGKEGHSNGDSKQEEKENQVETKPVDKEEMEVWTLTEDTLEVDQKDEANKKLQQCDMNKKLSTSEPEVAENKDAKLKEGSQNLRKEMVCTTQIDAALLLRLLKTVSDGDAAGDAEEEE